MGNGPIWHDDAIIGRPTGGSISTGSERRPERTKKTKKERIVERLLDQLGWQEHFLGAGLGVYDGKDDMVSAKQAIVVVAKQCLKGSAEDQYVDLNKLRQLANAARDTAKSNRHQGAFGHARQSLFGSLGRCATRDVVEKVLKFVEKNNEKLQASQPTAAAP